MQGPTFNVEEFKAGRNAITKSGRVAKFITRITAVGAAYPLVVQVGDEVRRYADYGGFGVGSQEDLVHMEPQRTGYSVRVSVGEDGKPKLEYAEVAYDPHLPNSINIALHINGFK